MDHVHGRRAGDEVKGNPDNPTAVVCDETVDAAWIAEHFDAQRRCVNRNRVDGVLACGGLDGEPQNRIDVLGARAADGHV